MTLLFTKAQKNGARISISSEDVLFKTCIRDTVIAWYFISKLGS